MLVRGLRCRWLQVLGIVCVLCACGCDPDPEPPKPLPTALTTQPARADDPPPPPEVEDVVSSPILIKPLDPDKRWKERSYTQTKGVPSGGLLAVCYIPGSPAIPDRPKVNLTEGPTAIRNPEPKEIEYYKGRVYYRGYAGKYQSKRRGRPVSHAVVMVRNVEKGTRAPLDRNGLEIWDGMFKPPLILSATNDRVQIKNYDAFPGSIVIREIGVGTELMKQALPPNNTKFQGHGAFDKKQLFAWTLTQWRRLARSISSPPIRSGKYFRVSCERRPWLEASVVVVDNPCVAVSINQHRKEGFATIGGVPVGQWVVEAWHPVFEPEERTRTVEIKKGETLEIPIKFKLPQPKSGGQPVNK
jgi:hypothetical protein